nr:hypothetical protein [Lusitaniella coriacea]
MGIVADTTGVEVWTLHLARPIDSHLSVLAQKSTRRHARNPKTDIVVAVTRIVPIAIRGTAVPRIVVPRTTPQQV